MALEFDRQPRIPIRTEKRLGRYALVTLVASPANLLLYWFFLRATHWSAVTANLAAAILVVVPTYVANRLWVWPADGTPDVRREILIYWLLTLLNVGVASAAVAVAEALGASEAKLVVVLLGSYVVVWLARFAILDRYFTIHS